MSAGLFPDQSVTLAGWQRATYEDLGDLLGGAVVGDTVSQDLLERADVIAFEMNGSAPGASGGWESGDFVFHDSQGSIVVHWIDGTSPATRDAHILANGTITGAAYGGFFNIPSSLVIFGEPSLTPEQVQVSFLLFRVREEIDVTGNAFRLTLSGVPASSPDPDAIGVLLHEANQPDKPVKPVGSRVRAVYDLCHGTNVEQAVLPALVALWDRHSSGSRARNPFEQQLFDVYSGLADEERTSIDTAFAQFKTFRSLGIDGCVFTDRLAKQLESAPPAPEDFAAEAVREGLTFTAENFLPGSNGQIGGGKARPVAGQVTANGEHPPPGPYPWITSIIPQAHRPDIAFGSTASHLVTSTNPPWHPGPEAFLQDCHLQPSTGGPVNQFCERVAATGSSSGLPVLTCPGGSDYVYETSCLRFPIIAAGSSVTLRGFNFITPSAKVTLTLRDTATDAPFQVALDGIVFGDQITPLTGPDGKVIADWTVNDYIMLQVPSAHPVLPETAFPPGLYDVQVAVTDTSSGSPVVRHSNALILQIDPPDDVKFALTSESGRCAEATSGPGDDEIWWTAFRATIDVQAAAAAPGQSVPPIATDLTHIDFPRGPWSDMSAGKEVVYAGGLPAPTLWDGSFSLDPPGRDGTLDLHRDGVIAVTMLGFEVDSEAAANEDIVSWWGAFAKAMTTIGEVVLGGGAAAGGLASLAEKAGVSVSVSADAIPYVLGAAAYAGAITVVCAGLWAAWAPADLVGVDVFFLDVLTAVHEVSPDLPVPSPTERSWRVDGDWMVVRDRPQPKKGDPGESRMTWVNSTEYLSPKTDSRYVLDFYLRQTG
jgi:hypothetical protein